MTGQELFAIYKAMLSAEGVGMDSWDDIEPSDRAAWVATAAECNRAYGQPQRGAESDT